MTNQAAANTALTKLNSWYQTLGKDEQAVISELVRSALTPPEERATEDVSGFALTSAACRGLAQNAAPTILADLRGIRGVGLAAVFLLDGPPVR